MKKLLLKLSSPVERAREQIALGRLALDCFDATVERRDQDFMLAVLSSSIHHAWQNASVIFRRIAIDLDRDLPRGRKSGERLVQQMAERVGDRPAIISPNLKSSALVAAEFHRGYRRAVNNSNSGMQAVEIFEIVESDLMPDIIKNLQKFAQSSKISSQNTLDRHASGSVLIDMVDDEWACRVFAPPQVLA